MRAHTEVVIFLYGDHLSLISNGISGFFSESIISDSTVILVQFLYCESNHLSPVLISRSGDYCFKQSLIVNTHIGYDINQNEGLHKK